MAKVIALNWRGFMNGYITPKTESTAKIIVKSAGVLYALSMPYMTYAAVEESDSWREIFSTVLGIVDWLVVGVFIFSGIKWMFGDRTKAIELLIGGSVGYLIARHAIDIRDWLRTL